MAQVTDTISAKARTAGSKGDARKLRAAGLLPAIAYGPGEEPQFLALDPKVFKLQRQSHGPGHLFNLDVEEGRKFKVLVKEVQRDPVSRELLHVDLYTVDMKRPIRVEVPVELVGKHAGAIDGGLLSQILRRVAVQCLPGNIPQKITADVTHMKIGDSLHMSDLKLPEGVKLVSLRDEAVAAVVEPDAAPAATTTAAAGATPAAGAAPADDKAKAGEAKKDEKKK